ncbi:hypothetical protein LCGC14_1922260, partial [marine sediment metagenome]
ADFVPDDTLQNIADAWRGMTEEQQVAIGEICEGYEDDDAIDVLLDTLTEGDESSCAVCGHALTDITPWKTNPCENCLDTPTEENNEGNRA